MSARLTIVDMVYWQLQGEQPIVISSQYGRELKTAEQPYIRRIAVNEGWTKIDLGWVKEAGLIVVANDPPIFSTQPTKVERELAESRVVELVWDTEYPWFGFRILPREDVRFHPIPQWDGEENKSIPFYVRCLNGSTKITVNAIPA